MSRNSTNGVLAAAVIVMAMIAAPKDSGAQSAASQTPPARERKGNQEKTVTVEGCLVREADVPGRDKDDDDYILTSTKMIEGAAPAAAAGRDRSASAPAGTPGTPPAMYEVEGIDESRLKQHVGQRVQLEGVFDDVDDPDDRDDLIEIRATMIRQVAGECPAKR